MIMETDPEPEPQDKEATFGIDWIEMPFLGDLFSLHYNLRNVTFNFRKKEEEMKTPLDYLPQKTPLWCKQVLK
jgi:hypothetical protein